MMERLLDKQIRNLECVVKDLKFDERMPFGKKAIEAMAMQLNKLKEYEEAEEQGLLHIAPCKNGTEIFYIAYKDFMEFEKVIFTALYLHGFTEYAHGEVGKGVFLTRAEAEQALSEVAT